MTDPTEQDERNAALRREVADRERAEYARMHGYCLALFGPGWKPHGRHFLIEADDARHHRHTKERPAPVATVYSARRKAEEQHFVIEGGTARPVANLAEGMPQMHEPHPTTRVTLKGEEVAPARYELCWGWFENAREPQSAEALAAARAKRQAKAVEAEAAGNLFAEAVRAEGPVGRGR